MLKHATINRTHKARDIGLNLQQNGSGGQVLAAKTDACSDLEQLQRISTANLHHRNESNSESVIKVFAQSLSQDVEYISVQINSQTKSSQVIRSLLRKFRLKHRDPNLFYLTLERWIRKDGLKSKNVMLLSDDSCPLQLQQCCSNPPHNDIKFTLQMRAGALVKVHCSDVVPNTRYKCLSLSTQTTVEQTIELMLHCLSLYNNYEQESNNRVRSTNSPGSTSTSSNSSSSGIESDLNCNSITSIVKSYVSQGGKSGTSNATTQATSARSLDSNSRASSVTSISASSNASSNISDNHLTEQFCLVIECTNTNYKRILDSDEYLADVYHNLLAEAKVQFANSELTESNNSQSHTCNANDSITSVARGNSQPLSPQNNKSFSGDIVRSISNSDQWFCIKLLRREEFNQPHHAIKFESPRRRVQLTNGTHHNKPLPSVPASMMNHFDEKLKQLVSTAQIEIASRPPAPPIPPARLLSGHVMNDLISLPPHQPLVDYNDNYMKQHPIDCVDAPMLTVDRIRTEHLPTESGSSLPPKYIILPPIKPRRRNLASATAASSQSTSSFGRPLTLNTRRRYDPSKLAEDLNKLDIYAPVTIDSVTQQNQNQPFNGDLIDMQREESN